jgi:hypothetical protein
MNVPFMLFLIALALGIVCCIALAFDTRSKISGAALAAFVLAVCLCAASTVFAEAGGSDRIGSSGGSSAGDNVSDPGHDIGTASGTGSGIGIGASGSIGAGAGH